MRVHRGMGGIGITRAERGKQFLMLLQRLLRDAGMEHQPEDMQMHMLARARKHRKGPGEQGAPPPAQSCQGERAADRVGDDMLMMDTGQQGQHRRRRVAARSET